MQTNYRTTPFEIKELSAHGSITGYASVFNEVDAQRDVVVKGAFAGSLAKYRHSKTSPAMLWMHDTAQPIGVWTQYGEDARGLLVKGQLALATRSGADAYELLKLGAVKGLSIGYSTVKSIIDHKTRIRTLTEVELFEISLVTFPANPLARVETVKTMTPPHDELQAIVMRLKQTAACLYQS